MMLDQVSVVLRARWATVALTTALFVLAALAITIALPRYEASAVLAVEGGGHDPVMAANQQGYRPHMDVSVLVATQADILKSESVALGALQKLGLHEQEEWRDRWRKATDGQGSFESWLAGTLLQKLEVRPSRTSNILTVTHASPDAEFSAALVNAFVQAYIDKTLQMRVAPARQFAAFFEERAKPLRAELEQARARLSAYEKKHGITVGDDPDVETARLAELTTQLTALQDAAAQAHSMRKQALAAPAALREVRNDPEVAVLTGELVRLESQLADLRSEFGEKHQSVIQVRQSIADARRRLDGAMRRSAESLATPTHVVDARLAEVRSAIARQREIVLKRKHQRDAAVPLLRDVENAEKAYGAVIARASAAALESANTTQANVTVIKAATPPLWSPNRLLQNAIVAGLLGFLLGIGRAVFAEHRDRRLRTLEDVTKVLRQPFLLALPDGEARSRQAAEQTRRRLVGSHPRLPWGRSA
ncbi:MAG TPA: Wzz/FepE/Etk N-terminal domain-containing protein [Burkholderiales bacterium]|nr:Wzz/FepE/Etk N-terminal domain-containing protein [Burkholderiales bacterium]